MSFETWRLFWNIILFLQKDCFGIIQIDCTDSLRSANNFWWRMKLRFLFESQIGFTHSLLLFFHFDPECCENFWNWIVLCFMCYISKNFWFSKYKSLASFYIKNHLKILKTPWNRFVWLDSLQGIFFFDSKKVTSPEKLTQEWELKIWLCVLPWLPILVAPQNLTCPSNWF